MSASPARGAGAKLPPLNATEDLKVEYANLVRIAHSPSELIFDFAHLLPGGAPANISSRIVMSPLGAKLFFRALGENLARYEAAFGEINIPRQSTLADHLFSRRQPGAPDEDAGESPASGPQE